MLRRSASALSVGMCPERLVWTRREKRLLRAHTDITSTQPLTPAPGRPPWEPALEALTMILEREALPPGSAVHVVLSNHFVRYLLVPWNEALLGEAERLAYASRAFHDIYGDSATAWDVRLSNDRYGAPAIASAVDKALLDALSGTLSSRSLQLHSVQPYFMSAFNRYQSQLGNRGAFVLAEPGKLVVGTYDQDQWRWIGTARLERGQDLAGQVTQMLYQGQQWDISSAAVHAGALSGEYWTANSALAVTHLLRENPALAGFSQPMAFCGNL